MREIWLGLVLAALFTLALALTRDWWLPVQDREAWHESWLQPRPPSRRGRSEIQEEHDRLLAKIEKEYGEKIAKEKALNEKYLAELERLRKEGKNP